MCVGDPVVQHLSSTQIGASASVLLPDVITVSDRQERFTGSNVRADGCLSSADTVAPVSPGMLPSDVQVSSYLDKGKAILEPHSTVTVYVPTVDGSFSTFADHVCLDGWPNAIAGTYTIDGAGNDYTFPYHAYRTPFTVSHQLDVAPLLDFHAGIVGRATPDNEVQQFSLTDLSQYSHHTAAVLSPTSTTYASGSAEPHQQRSQTTHVQVTGARVLDFAAGVTAPVPVDTEPQQFVLRGMSRERRSGRRATCRSHHARPAGIWRRSDVLG